MALPVEPMRVLIVSILLAASLAGCAGKAPSEADRTEGVLIDDGNLVVAPDMGAVRGVVRSEEGATVPAARVQLVGTTLFQQTDASGTFLFVNVTPPEVKLRVESQGFRVWEAPVPVAAQKVSLVNVTLLADLGLDPNARPHVHDMWRGQSEITVMDQSVPLTPFDPTDPSRAGSASLIITRANFERRGSYDIPLTLPATVPDQDMPADWPALIYPGTERIDVTLSWDSQDSNIDQLALGYHNATTNDIEYLELQASGSTWTIVVDDPYETDRGHQLFSLWGFIANSLNEATNTGTYRGPAYFAGDVDVQITVVRGPNVPLEPAHPDFWAGNTSLVLRSGEDLHIPSLAVTETYRDPANPAQHDININNAIVPPGTQRMRLEFSWSYPQGDGAAHVPEWVLTWRSADQHPASTPFSEYGRAAPVEGSNEEQRLVYELDVAPSQVDAYYQEDSRWGFLISPAGYEDDTMYPQWFRWRSTAPPEFRLEVTAFRG